MSKNESVLSASYNQVNEIMCWSTSDNFQQPMQRPMSYFIVIRSTKHVQLIVLNRTDCWDDVEANNGTEVVSHNVCWHVYVCPRRLRKAKQHKYLQSNQCSLWENFLLYCFLQSIFVTTWTREQYVKTESCWCSFNLSWKTSVKLFITHLATTTVVKIDLYDSLFILLSFRCKLSIHPNRDQIAYMYCKSWISSI